MELLLIYRPRRDGRLSWPSWLTHSGRLTHEVVTRQAWIRRRSGKVRQLIRTIRINFNLLFRKFLNLVLNKIGLFLTESINLLSNNFQLPELPAMAATDF